jgi:DNA polymerase-3 subunit chi
MARIDFYVLSRSGEQARRMFACRLAEKAYRLENTVHIQTATRAEAQQLDELLWTFRDGSFVPHGILGDSAGGAAAVTIGSEEEPQAARERDLLINLCVAIPAIAPSFPRIAELVTSDEDCRQSSRKRFSAYREQGHEIDTHNV